MTNIDLHPIATDFHDAVSDISTAVANVAAADVPKLATDLTAIILGLVASFKAQTGHDLGIVGNGAVSLPTAVMPKPLST